MFQDLLNRFIPWRYRSRNNFVKAHANHLFRAVLSTPPVSCSREAEIEVHSLVCKRDTNMLLLSAKSLLANVPDVALVIHEDGSLDEGDCRLIRHHLPSAHLIRRRDADRELTKHLRPDVVARRSDRVLLMKLFDFSHYCHSRRMIALDSDIVFTGRPAKVIEWIGQGVGSGSFYNQDPNETFRAEINPQQRSIPRNFNSGFIGFDTPIALEEIVDAMYAMDYWKEDQTIYAWLLAARGAKPLPRLEYFVFDGVAIPPEACMVHFINPVRFTTRTYMDVAEKVCKTLRQGTPLAAPV